MSLWAILLSFIFVIVALFLSMAFKLGLGKDLMISKYSCDNPIIDCRLHLKNGLWF